MDDKIKEFLIDINSKLGNVIEVVYKEDRSYPCFDLCLKKTDYVMMDQVVLNMDNKFEKLVDEIGSKYFGVAPSFNNTGRTFWFI